MNERPALSTLGLNSGKKARLTRDFFANPQTSDPRYIVRLAQEGGFTGIVLQVGLAEKFYWDYAGEVPLILKLNGKTEIPSDAEAFSPLHATTSWRSRPRASCSRNTAANRWNWSG